MKGDAKLVAIMPVRNEEWCIGLTARALLMWVDHLVVLNHASTDGTTKILHEILEEESDERFTILLDSNPIWHEMRQRQRLLQAARALKATHIVFIDADEILTGDLFTGIRDQIESLHPKKIMQLPWICLRGGINSYIKSGMWADQHASMAVVDNPRLYWQSSDGEEHFHHRHPKGMIEVPHLPVRGRMGGLMHLQFLSDRRLRAKQALYQMTERIRWPDRQPADYAKSVREAQDQSLGVAPTAWWFMYDHLLQHLDIHAEPWQEIACRELIRMYGPERFKDLDLFGVIGAAL